MSTRTPEQNALQRHIEAILHTIPLTETDYDANDNLTQEAMARIWPQILPQFSEAEREELAMAGLEELVERKMDEMVAEGKAERFTDEAGEVRFRIRHAN
jgi:hypothetical protein